MNYAKKSIPLFKKRYLGSIIEDSFRLYFIFVKQSLGLFIPLVLISSAIMYLLTQEVGSMTTLLGAFNSEETIEFVTNILLYVLGMALAYSLLIILCNEFLTLYALKENAMIIDSTESSDISIAEMMDSISRNFWKYWIYGLGIAIIVFISAFFFVIPAIYLAVVFVIYFPVLRIENLSFSAAISRSIKLTTDYWWKILGYLLIMAILINIMQYIISIPALLFGFAGAITGNENELANEMASGFSLMLILSTALGFATLPLTYCLNYLIYGKLVVAKDKRNLHLEVDNLGR